MITYQSNFFDKEENLVEMQFSTCDAVQKQRKKANTLRYVAVQQVVEPNQTSIPPPRKYKPSDYSLFLMVFILGYIAGMTQNFSPETWTYLQSLLESLLTLL